MSVNKYVRALNNELALIAKQLIAKKAELEQCKEKLGVSVAKLINNGPLHESKEFPYLNDGYGVYVADKDIISAYNNAVNQKTSVVMEIEHLEANKMAIMVKIARLTADYVIEQTQSLFHEEILEETVHGDCESEVMSLDFALAAKSSGRKAGKKTGKAKVAKIANVDDEGHRQRSKIIAKRRLARQGKCQGDIC